MAKDFKNRVREQFGRAAEGYVRDKGFAGGDDLAEAERLLKPTLDDNMLDVACGGGHTALYFAPKVRSVVASDLTMQMLKKAQEYISEEWRTSPSARPMPRTSPSPPARSPCSPAVSPPTISPISPVPSVSSTGCCDAMSAGW